MTVDGCVIVGNASGVISYPPVASPDAGIVRVSNSVIAFNIAHGIWYRNGHIYSRGDNTVVGNSADNVFLESFAAK